MFGTRDHHPETWLKARRAALVALFAVLATATPLVAVASPASSADAEAVADAMVGALYDGDDSTNPVGLASLRTQVWGGLSPAADGSGVDVAVIDTGVSPVDGLAADRIVNGPDFSTEAITAAAHLDSNGHGTHIAGIIAGDRDGAAGIAPGARIVNVKVAGRSGNVSTEQLVGAIDWVVANRQAGDLNIRVLNLAAGNGDVATADNDPLSAAVQRAWDAGITVVVAAGNEGDTRQHLDSPAVNPYVIAVGASDATAGLAADLQPVPAWSARGDGDRNPDLVAPGRSIASYRVPGSDADENHETGRYGEDLFLGSGTSQSAAVVSGVAAVLLEVHPTLTPDEVKATLMGAASTALDEPVEAIGAGVVDGTAAVAAPAFGAPMQTHTRPAAFGVLPADSGVNGATWYGTSWAGTAWSGTAWSGTAWSGTAWSGTAWSGTAWSGTAWSGTAWSGTAWSGTAWSGTAWSGTAWSGTAWSGTAWSGTAWSGTAWSGTAWSGTAWSGTAWSGTAWSGTAWSGTAWSGTAWSGTAWSGTAWS